MPKFLPDGTRNDVALVSLNHKMGNHATTNALLNFGDGTHQPDAEPGAVGYLVGEEHKGLAYMFHMMNEARIAVGMQATATGYAGYLASVEYAKERTQGRPVDAKDPSRPQVSVDRACRRQANAVGAEVLCRGRARARPVLPRCWWTRGAPAPAPTVIARICCSRC